MDVVPALDLSTRPLIEAESAIDRAVAALRGAQEVEWVSMAATAYRAELFGVLRDLRVLADRVDVCRDRWTRARWAAYESGQL